jgi:hypothetical protein
LIWSIFISNYRIVGESINQIKQYIENYSNITSSWILELNNICITPLTLKITEYKTKKKQLDNYMQNIEKSKLENEKQLEKAKSVQLKFSKEAENTYSRIYSMQKETSKIGQFTFQQYKQKLDKSITNKEIAETQYQNLVLQMK